jgi:hypothetical protein
VTGLVNGETIAVNETSPGTVASASQSVEGSPYLITPSLAKGGTLIPSNYTIAFVGGLLYVTPVIPAIVKSIALVQVQSFLTISTEVQPQQQDELMSVVPAETAPVKILQTSPNI